MARKIILAAVTTLLFFYLARTWIGFTQMDHCPEMEPYLTRCIETQNWAGLRALIISAIMYVGALWLVLRRRKKAD